jgi:iron complex outermembrane receptor protein
MSHARRVLRLCSVLLLVFAAFLTRSEALLAQTRSATGTVAGAVLDPDGKAVVGAPVLARNVTSVETRTTTTDGAGRFSIANLNPGSYAIEVYVPGFDTVRRTGVQLTGGNTEELAIRLNVANITESVTVSAALPAAAVAAPSQASLTARSAQSLISNEYIRNYTSPVSDYSQVLQMAPGTFSVSANGPGLGDTKTFSATVLGQIPVSGDRQHLADRVRLDHAPVEQHAESEGIDARADRAGR